jgi:general secretion pathway protein G
MRLRFHRRAPRTVSPQAGMTLIELIVACTILIILAGAALPTARLTVRRQQERELRLALREIRTAIDRYKDLADRNLIQVELGTEGYPPDLDTLVRGVTLAGAPDRRVRFLRRIPVDPMTGQADWGLRSVQDSPDARSWGGQNVFDVYSRSYGTALDGTQYQDW